MRNFHTLDGSKIRLEMLRLPNFFTEGEMRRITDMTAPVRAPKKPKNQPRPFQETLAPTLPMAPAAAGTAHPKPALSDRQLHTVLVLIWVAVMILVGAALGLRLLASQSDTALPGVPVATAPVNVASLPKALPIVNSSVTSFAQPPVINSHSIQQAQSGNPFKVIGGAAYQPTAGPDALQPGYATGVRLQGNQGTTPAL
jgi:hypothetical protein